MVIGDTIAGVLPELQAQAESLMRDVCEIREPGTREFDRNAEVEVRVIGSLIYSGKCRWRREKQQARVEASAEQQVTTVSGIVSVPVHVSVAADYVVTLTDSADGQIVGEPLTVTDVETGTHLTARRIHAIANLG